MFVSLNKTTHISRPTSLRDGKFSSTFESTKISPLIHAGTNYKTKMHTQNLHDIVTIFVYSFLVSFSNLSAMLTPVALLELTGHGG